MFGLGIKVLKIRIKRRRKRIRENNSINLVTEKIGEIGLISAKIIDNSSMF